MAAKDEAAMAAAFEAARPALFGMAYRMLGTRADAEDVLQDVFLRWSEADRDGIRNPPAWLMTTCTRRAIDALRSVARARTDYVGAWLPEPLEDVANGEPHELSFALETAFLVVLERASPKERAAFLLHEVFGLGHAEVGTALGVSEATSRKLASRARVRLASGERRERLELNRQRTLLTAFQHAILTDDMDSFSAVLADDVRLDADGGGKATAVAEPLQGRMAVLAFCEQARKWWRGYDWTVMRLATGYGTVLRDGPTIAATIWFDSTDGHSVSGIYVMRNPDKLRSIGVTTERDR